MLSLMTITMGKETLKLNMSVFATVVVKIMNTFSIGIKNHIAPENPKNNHVATLAMGSCKTDQ